MSRTVRHIKDILWVVALFGLVAAVFRMWFGLGATTNLSDGMPWGLWKVFNMIAGVALSTSGFTIGLLVYVLKLERFRPYVKPAILIAFLGYGCSCTALLFDIGLPHRFWHPILMWNEHSFLFEVFWCVLLYFNVTAIELAPALLERFRTEKVIKWLHRIAFGVVVTGISLSSLHHSSLGSLFLVTPTRLHPLWYSSMLPVLFILSAIGAGLMTVILVRIVYARLYDPNPVFGANEFSIDGQSCVIENPLHGVQPDKVTGPEMTNLSILARIAATVLGIYLLAKLIDLSAAGGWQHLLNGTWESWLLIGELAMTAIIPVLLVAIPWSQRSPYGLAVAAASAIGGLVLNRLNVGIFGFIWDAHEVYFPSLAEWAVGLGVIAAAGLIFIYLSENFSIFSKDCTSQRETDPDIKPSFDTLAQVWITAWSDPLPRVSLIAVAVIPLAWILMYPPFVSGQATDKVAPSSGVDALRTVLLIDGDSHGFACEFPHVDHQNRMGREASCVSCHHASLPNDHSTPCSRCHAHMLEPTDIFDHSGHFGFAASKESITGFRPENRSCVVCHEAGQPKEASRAKSCMDCHETDIWVHEVPAPGLNPALACGFHQAMHGRCIECHVHEAKNSGREDLGECSTCHKSRRVGGAAHIAAR